MTIFQEDVLSILRVMQEEKARTNTDEAPEKEIRLLTRLDEEKFSQARNYMINSGYIVRDPKGKDTYFLRLLSEGSDFLESKLAQRESITLDGERILKNIIKLCPDIGLSVSLWDENISIGLDHERSTKAIHELEVFEFVEIKMSQVAPSIKGRRAVLNEFRLRQAPVTQYQTGTIIAGDVHAQNFQSFANAINSQFEQSITITENDPAVLQEQISELLKALVSEIIPHLDSPEQQAAYTQAAIEIQKELDKPDPEIEAIKKWTTVLNLLSSALSLGNQTFDLALKASPYIILLYKFIGPILQP